MKQETKAQLELAKAMNRLAEGLERFQDPDWWQRAAGQAFQTMANIPAIAPIISQALPPGVNLESIIVRLSDEEREEMSQKVYEALKPQLIEFEKFVKESLVGLPPNKLKELAAKIDKGEELKLEKRPCCVFIVFEDGYSACLNL